MGAPGRLCTTVRSRCLRGDGRRADGRSLPSAAACRSRAAAGAGLVDAGHRAGAHLPGKRRLLGRPLAPPGHGPADPVAGLAGAGPAQAVAAGQWPDHRRDGAGLGRGYRRLLLRQGLRQAQAGAAGQPGKSWKAFTAAWRPAWRSPLRSASTAAGPSACCSWPCSARRWWCSSRSSATSPKACSSASPESRTAATCCPATVACWIVSTA